MQAVIMPDEQTPYPLRIMPAPRCRAEGDSPTQYQLFIRDKHGNGNWRRIWIAIGEGPARFYITRNGAQQTVQMIGRWKEGPTNITHGGRPPRK